MKKKIPARTIVLNVMYNGKYLNNNMGHEVINLFNDDYERNYLYLNPYGNFSSIPSRNVETMVMVIPVPKKNMFEVVAIATGLTEVYKPVANYNPTLEKDKRSEANEKAESVVRERQLNYIKEEKVTYGGVALDKLFTNDDQQAIFITYKAAFVKRPKKRIYITFQGTAGETEDCAYIPLSSCQQCKMSQKQYISSLSDSDRGDWQLLNDKLLGNPGWWEDYSLNITEEKKRVDHLSKQDSLFDICGIIDNELVFSNAIAYYIEKYPHLFKAIFDLTTETIVVEREYKHIDILIKDGTRRIIVENKIHSAINRKGSDKGNESQLNRYWEELTQNEGFDEESVKGIILCPEYYREQMTEEVLQYKCGEFYTVLSYNTLWEELRDADELQYDNNFKIFVDALQKHTYDSIPNAKYEEMKNKFINRIMEILNKLN